MKNITNPIAIQSREWIVESLKDLMKKKDYKDITISEIATHAQLARRTFYRNFSSKEEVLEACIDKIIDEFLKKMETYESFTLFDSLHEVLCICDKNRDFVSLIIKNNLLQVILSKWRKTVIYLHDSSKFNIVGIPDVSDEELSYMVCYFSGGFFCVIEKWLNDGMIMSIEELAKKIKLVMPYHVKLEEQRR